jgi:phosphatidylglycerol:prolipoprotein diacylglycerol transferase
MHPTLFHVPLPALRVPVAALASIAALVSLVIFVAAARRGRRDVLAFAVAGAVLSLIALFARRGADLVWGSFAAPAWGLCLGLALTAGGWLTFQRATRAGFERGPAVRALLFGVLFGLAGARVAYALGHLSSEEGVISLLAGSEFAGLEIAGGVPFAVAGVAFAFGRDRAVLSYLDAAAPALGLGVFLTRLGCYLEGCDFGVPLRDGGSRLAGLGTFPAQSPAWVTHVLERGLSPSAGSSLPVHPTQLYEAAGGLALMALVAVSDRRLRGSPGRLALLAIAGFVALRLGVDLFRDDRVHVVTFRLALLALPLSALYVRSLEPSPSPSR